MTLWAYLAAAVSVCIILRYTVFRAPEVPTEILKEETIGSRMARREREQETLKEIARQKKLSISLDLLEFERKKARADRVQEVYEHLVVKIKSLNVTGQRKYDAGHPGAAYRNYDRDLGMLHLRPYPEPLRESELAEIAESNAIGEEVATMLRRNGIGVDTSGKMAYDGSIFDRDRRKNRMIITW